MIPRDPTTDVEVSPAQLNLLLKILTNKPREQTMKLARIQRGLIALTTVAAFTFVSDRSTAPARAQASSNSLSTIKGRVILVGNRVAGASVTLYAAGEGTPTEVARSKTDAEGRFQLDARS